jgi:excisionase family DNA binding protein
MKEIMTPREAAEYLSVHVRTLYRLVKHGEIPGRKIGGSWRFKKDALDEWLSCRKNLLPLEGIEGEKTAQQGGEENSYDRGRDQVGHNLIQK